MIPDGIYHFNEAYIQKIGVSGLVHAFIFIQMSAAKNTMGVQLVFDEYGALAAFRVRWTLDAGFREWTKFTLSN